ncbi:MAG: Maff2 family protein [Oscillospiraceae bacterium]|jgi:uncharacterized membrane protein|nr:Maff2 family protein [Oscillospiraceae bacterium]
MNKFYKRVYVAVMSIITFVMVTAINVNAASFDTSTLKANMKLGLTAVVSTVGATLAVFGIIHLIQAQGEHEPDAKSKAIKQLASGVGVIIVGAIMIPALIDSVTF